jgi:hypothetical protein
MQAVWSEDGRVLVLNASVPDLATFREMLKGVPLPPGFDPKRIPNLHETNDRYQVGAAVGGGYHLRMVSPLGRGDPQR